MALTHSSTHEGVHGDQRYRVATVTFDNSYPTGGEAVTAADFNLTSIEYLQVSARTASPVPRWDSANSTILLIDAPTGAEVANASDQSSVVIDVMVHGQ